ncbi:hypothetical protein EJV47_08840 [Hymenobacter gummosus]|uniref:Uncharacterized protein n=1 Tax=Hymenobacter gummosus TaxID=1776032 RepID=A0A431U4E9_9BACT|nr:hypothetical protein [Hymenobacter gummosus]RTQ50726.1 hypothetical protein EJV47_08840 [Hymenobacter gummosus]
MGISSDWLVAVSKQLNVLSVVSALVPAAVGLMRRHFLTAAGRCLWACTLLGSLLFGGLCEYGRIVLHNNLLFLRTQVWLEAVLIGLAYYHTFTSPRRRRILLGLMVVFTLGAIYETGWLMDWRVSNSPYLHVGQAVLLIGLGLAYFEQLLSHPHRVRLTREPMFLASVGSVLYCAGTVFVYVLETRLNYDTDLIRMIFILEYGLRIVALSGLLTAALALDGQTRLASVRARELPA